MIPSVPDVVPAGRMAATTQPVLVLGSGTLLRPWREGDAEVIVEAAVDPEIQRWNRPGKDVSLADARERVTRWTRSWAAETAAVWAVVPPGDERPVGLVGCGDLVLRAGSGEIAYWLLPAARGRGFVGEAVVRVGRWALEELGLHRLRLTHSVHNPASCRVAEKAGFVLEGTMRSALLHADGWHDEHLHGLVGAGG
ncbi:acetyltransferase [Streptomyces spiroverticillatus]|uniref:Acetyltransferase n=1 Tax=Streptomyces finlayi TaxID=67296 RepID=A0A918WUQ1_9ACTN|nr:GNAT family N-acetyltransferase [Streptomyces finlayi]GHA00190.1 acetyltransferase [Streptomyces spiroverticillatus]GHC84688.1 acetyltransferase [Streptomyces finlayi]